MNMNIKGGEAKGFDWYHSIDLKTY